MKEVLRFDNVSMHYHSKQGETLALENVNFSVWFLPFPIFFTALFTAFPASFFSAYSAAFFSDSKILIVCSSNLVFFFSCGQMLHKSAAGGSAVMLPRLFSAVRAVVRVIRQYRSAAGTAGVLPPVKVVQSFPRQERSAGMTENESCF